MGDPIRVPLANGKGFALIDAEDAGLVDGFCWYLHKSNETNVYARAYVPGSGRAGKRQVFMHQLIAGLGADHISGDGLDNRRANLRPALHALNIANQRPRRGVLSSRFKGVSLDGRSRRYWHAYIRVGQKRRFLGSFATEEDAARAYDAAALAAWGEYARLNFP